MLSQLPRQKGLVWAQSAPFGGPGGPWRAPRTIFGHYSHWLLRLCWTHGYHTLWTNIGPLSVWYGMLFDFIVWFYAEFYFITMYCMTFHCIVSPGMVLYGIVFHLVLLHGITVLCTVVTARRRTTA